MELMEYVEKTVGLMSGNSPATSLYQYLLDHGVYTKGARGVKNHPVLGRLNGVDMLKGCYRNASLIALVLDEAKYFEGVARRLIPMSHAWVEYDGEIYDPTWERFGDIGESEYLGVEVPKEYVKKMVDYEGWMTPLLFMVNER